MAHPGECDEHLPTVHGFDKFFGNLYHLDADKEPEDVDYPNEKHVPNFKQRFGPRGVLHCRADGKGGQKIENTGLLTKTRMETRNGEFPAAAKKISSRPRMMPKSWSLCGSTPRTCPPGRR